MAVFVAAASRRVPSPGSVRQSAPACAARPHACGGDASFLSALLTRIVARKSVMAVSSSASTLIIASWLLARRASLKAGIMLGSAGYLRPESLASGDGPTARRLISASRRAHHVLRRVAGPRVLSRIDESTSGVASGGRLAYIWASPSRPLDPVRRAKPNRMAGVLGAAVSAC